MMLGLCYLLLALQSSSCYCSFVDPMRPRPLRWGEDATHINRRDIIQRHWHPFRSSATTAVAARDRLTVLLLQRFSSTSITSNEYHVDGATDTEGGLSSSSTNSKEKEQLNRYQKENHPIGLYIHIPYCRRRCRYCNFAILPIGTNIDTDKSVGASTTSTETSLSKQELGFDIINQNYLDALRKELKSICDTCIPSSKSTQQQQQQQQQQQPKIPLCSIYFGGGTPSLAPIDTIAQILLAACGDCDDAPFTLLSNAEITIEMDPGTFNTEKLQQLKNLGINRISLGVQSFDNNVLAIMGRVHRQSDVEAAIQSVRTVFGLEANYSIDLISGVPGLSLAKWIDTLQQAVSLEPPPKHLSVYDLQVEESTVFGTWYGNENENEDENDNRVDDDNPQNMKKKGKNALFPLLPGDEDCAFMYKYASGYLKAKNYEHYEVSSYAAAADPHHHDHRTTAIPNDLSTSTTTSSIFRSKHNQIYWSLDSSWYAIGLGASSYVNGHTVARPKTLQDYFDWVKKIEEGRSDDDDNDENDIVDLEILEDAVLKRLRTSDGLDLGWVKDQFGQEAVNNIMKGAEIGFDLGYAKIIYNNPPSNSGNQGEQLGILRLKDPDGLLYSNYIISSIFAELEEGVF